MKGIPKIVLDRLKLRRVGAPDNRRSAIDDRQFQHPDANLLAAFLERTLTERERTQVLSHLAECAECREIAALTLPAAAEAAEPARAPVGSGWSVRPILRWGALAAALAAVVLVAVLRQHSRSRVQTASNTAPSTIMAKASEAARQAPEALPAQPTTRAAKRRAQPKSLESAGEMTKLQHPAPTPPTQRFAASPPRNEGRNLTPPKAQLRPPAAPPAIPQNSQSAEISAGLSTDLIHAAAQPSAVVEHPPAPTYDKRSLAGEAGASSPMRAKALQARLSASAFGSRLQGSRDPARRALEHFAGRQTTTLGGRRKELAGSGRGRQSRIPSDPGERQGYLGGRKPEEPCITRAMAARLGPVSTRLPAPLPPQKPSSRSVAPHPTFNRSPSKPPPGRSGYPTTAASTGER